VTSLESEVASLPQGPLTMSMLLGLSSSSLRRLLKAGLKRGLNEADLAALVQAEWGSSLEAQDVQGLLAALQERGWLVHHAPEQIWKTRLGNPVAS
jgi:hypothetical protein